MWRAIVFAMLLVTMAVSPPAAHATFFDLRGRTIPAPPATLVITLGGIQPTPGTGGPGSLVSTATRFGIDNSSSLDVPDLIDGGSGTAEQLSFVVTSQSGSGSVILDSVLISAFD